MELSQRIVIKMVFLASYYMFSSSSCLQDKEEVFAIYNLYLNRVFADGKEVTTSYIIDQSSITAIHGFCIPHEATVVAVTNVFVWYPKVYFFGSLGERLVTNNEWKCVNVESSGDWYQPWFNDTAWPNAYSKKPLPGSAFISKNAQAISSVLNESNRYFCRGRVKPYKKEPTSRSALAARIATNQRFVNHFIQSFLVDEILECLTHCMDFDQCVSMNYEPKSNTCELNSETNTKYPQNMEQRDGFSYYNVMKP